MAAADSTCVDFDDGQLPSGGGMDGHDRKPGDVGADDAARFEPAVLVAGERSRSVMDSKAALVWHDVGAQPIASVTVAADVSPVGQGLVTPWTGSVSLLCVDLGSGHACLAYTMGVDTSFATAYTGYYLTMEYDGGGVSFNEYQIYGALQANIWTRVQMQITASSELIQITIPGTTNAPITGRFDPDTAVDVTVGPETSGATSGWSGYLDNIVVDVTRSN